MCPPPHQRHTRRAVGRAGGIFWKTPDTGLASYSIISLRYYLIQGRATGEWAKLPSGCIRRNTKSSSSGFAEVLITLSFWERMNLYMTPWEAGVTDFQKRRDCLHTPQLYYTAEKLGLPTSQLSRRRRDFLLPNYPREPCRDLLLPNYSREPETSFSQIPAIPENLGLPTSQLSQRSRDFLIPNYPREPGTRNREPQRSRNCLIPIYPREAGTA